MKNQWFGDVYDFRKYGLLEFLSGYYDYIVVSWMLTPDDSFYGIDIPVDQPILSHIKTLILQHRQTQFAAEYFKGDQFNNKFIFWEENLPPGSTFDKSRNEWNNKLKDIEQKYKEKTLYFFDADNGFSPTVCTNDEEKESIYIYQDEFKTKYENGADILLYQHRQRSQSFEAMYNTVAKNLSDIPWSEPKPEIICIKATGNVAFFLLYHASNKITFPPALFGEKEEKEYMSIYK